MENDRGYDTFYSKGGWQYNYDKERASLAKTIATRIPAKSSILEIGCGQGLHARVMHDLGFNVTAVDLSKRGIEQANREFSTATGPKYMFGDAGSVLKNIADNSFDCVFSRGMSWFHYEYVDDGELKPVMRERLDSIFRVLAPGGILLSIIRTNLSGKPASNGIFNHRYDDFAALAKPYGPIIHRCDLLGDPVGSEQEGKDRGIDHMTIMVRKPGGIRK